jgi:hypothetical protein
LAISDPATGAMVMIERLAGKPESKTVEEWLHEAAKDTVLTPIEREEWFTLSGSRALKVINDRSENIYAVRGPLTIAIRYDRSPQAVTRQIISTFRFTARQ